MPEPTPIMMIGVATLSGMWKPGLGITYPKSLQLGSATDEGIMMSVPRKVEHTPRFQAFSCDW
jgi:hypothetical protein